jgi:hypothetical protein
MRTASRFSSPDKAESIPIPTPTKTKTRGRKPGVPNYKRKNGFKN